MKRIIALVLIVMMIGLFSTVSYGETLGYGARALGMGGAFTAVADDGTAPYWNPAGITQKLLVVTPSVGLSGDVSKALDILQNTEFPPDFPAVNLNLNASGGLTTKWFGVNAFVDVEASTTNNGDTDKTGNAQGYGYLVLTGATKLGPLAVGANFKKIIGQSMDYYVNTTYPCMITGSGDGMAFDVGALYKFSLPILGDLFKVGVVARNLGGSVKWTETETPYTWDGSNFGPGTPETPSTYTETLIPTYVAGVAVRVPIIGTIVAGDYEITSEGNNIHIGLEQSLLLLKVRAGMFTYGDGTETGYSAGLGLSIPLLPIVLDAAAVKTDVYGFYLTGGIRI